MQVEDFHYLKQSGCVSIPGVSDAIMWRQTVEAMNVIGLTQKVRYFFPHEEDSLTHTNKQHQEQFDMLKILAAILHLGNVSFQEGRDDSSRLDHKESLDTACSLLGSNMAELSRSFLERTFTAGGGEVVTTPLTKAKAENSRVN